MFSSILGCQKLDKSSVSNKFPVNCCYEMQQENSLYRGNKNAYRVITLSEVF